MNAARKYLFDLNFEAELPEETPAAQSAPGPAEEPSVEAEPEAPPPPSFSLADMEAARQEAFHAGQEKGRAEALAGIEQETSAQLSRLATDIAALLDGTAEKAAEQEVLSLEVMRRLAEKLFPAAAQRQGLAEIERVIADCIERLRDEARLVVRTADHTLEAVQKATERLAAQKNFEGRLIFLTEPDLGPSDVVVEWADGGAERDLSALLDEVGRYFARLGDSMGSDAPALAHPPSQADEASRENKPDPQTAETENG